MKRWIMIGLLGVGLGGCSMVPIEQMNTGLDRALGQPVARVTEALGQPDEVARESDRVKYRWYAPHHVQPCSVEVLVDSQQVVRKTSWSGYVGSCEAYASGLSRVYPN